MNNKMKLFGLGMFLILLLGVVIPSVLAQELIPEEPMPITTTTLKTTTTTTIATTTTVTTTTLKPTTTTMVFPDDPVEAISVVNTKVIDIYSKVQSSDLKLDFFGTEYQAGASGTIWLQLLRNYQPINDASCYATAYYPDKSVYLNRTLMSYLSGSDGLYYYDLIVPSVQGVYMLSAVCYIPEQAFIDNFLDYSNLEEYMNVTIIDGKVILYPFVGAWTALDSSGNNRDGTLINMESSDWVVGKLNGALIFDGVNEYVDLENIANFDKEQSFSVEGWVKTISNKTQNIISRRDTQPNIERGWEFQIKNGKLKFTVSRSITNTYWVSQESLQNINDGNWHHVVATWTGVIGSWGYPSNIKLYIDGQLADSYPSGNVVGWSIMNDAHCQISGKVFDTYSVFDGVIDEVVVYTRVISLSEVQFRYNNGTGTETMIADVFPYGWWHLNPVIGATSGYIKSSLISLSGVSWLEYFSDYILHDGSINFKILSSNNTVLCNNLGDISGCAGAVSSIKLYAELTKPYLNSTSPAIDSWWVRWIIPTIEEIRGSSELHVSALSVNNSAIADEVIIKMLMNARILNDRVVNFHNHQYCTGNMTLQHNVTYEYCAGSGDCRQMADIMDENCAYGCDYANASCKPSPMLSFIIFIVGIIIFVVVAVMIGRFV